MSVVSHESWLLNRPTSNMDEIALSDLNNLCSNMLLASKRAQWFVGEGEENLQFLDLLPQVKIQLVYRVVWKYTVEQYFGQPFPKPGWNV